MSNSVNSNGKDFNSVNSNGKDFTTRTNPTCEVILREVTISEGRKDERVGYFYTWGKFTSQTWEKPQYRANAITKHKARGLSSFLVS